MVNQAKEAKRFAVRVKKIRWVYEPDTNTEVAYIGDLKIGRKKFNINNTYTFKMDNIFGMERAIVEKDPLKIDGLINVFISKLVAGLVDSITDNQYGRTFK